MPVKRLAALGLLFTLATCSAFACTKAPPPQPAAFDAAAGNAEPASSSSSTPTGAVCVVDTDKMKAAMAAVGGSGTGQAQDATVQQIIKLYGASIPQGGTGTGLCQDASLQALYLLIAGQLDGGSSGGVAQLDGNVVGPSNNNTVVEIQNQPVEAGTSNGQVWIFNGTAWVPGFLPGSDGGAIVVTLAGDTTGPSNANTNVAMQGQAVSAGASNGQVWIFNGTAWVPGFVGSIIDGGTIQLAGDVNGAANANRVYGITGDGGNTYYVTPSIHLWGADAGQPTITQAASTVGNGQTLYIISQQEVDGGPDAGLYFSPGGIVLETPAPIGDGGGGILGPLGTVAIQNGAAPYVLFQDQAGIVGTIWLGNTAVGAPTSTNFALESVGSVTSINATTQDTLLLNGGVAIGVTSATVTVQPETIQWISVVTGSNPTITQATLTSDVAAETMTIQAQGAYPDAGSNPSGADLQLAAGQGAILNGGSWQSGKIVLDIQSPNDGGTEKYVQMRRNGTPLVQEGLLTGSAAGSGAIYGPVTPSNSNYAISFGTSGNNTFNVAGSQTLVLSVAGTSELLVTASLVSTKQPVGGVSGTNAFSWSSTSVALTSGSNISLTSAQYNNPHIKFTGALTGAGTTVTFPATDGACWDLDFSAVTTITDSVGLIANSNTWSVAVASVGTEYPHICYSAGTGRIVGVSMIQFAIPAEYVDVSENDNGTGAWLLPAAAGW